MLLIYVVVVVVKINNSCCLTPHGIYLRLSARVSVVSIRGSVAIYFGELRNGRIFAHKIYLDFSSPLGSRSLIKYKMGKMGKMGKLGKIGNLIYPKYPKYPKFPLGENNWRPLIMSDL